jgi:hypothetical protein
MIKMFDYIQIYEKYSQFGSYIIPAKDRLICSALGAIVFVIVWHILRDKIVDGLLVLSSLLLTAVFAFGYFSLFASPENSENLAQVKRYNVRSITSLGNNIVAVQEELGNIENKTEETNKILNKFYKGDKNLSPDEEKIVKKLKN